MRKNALGCLIFLAILLLVIVLATASTSATTLSTATPSLPAGGLPLFLHTLGLGQ